MPARITSKSKLNGVSVAAIGAGSMFVWSGIKGWSLLGTIGDVISGKQPNQKVAYPLSDGSGGSGGGTGSNADIAHEALSHIGHCYVFGGAPGKSGNQCWDCSSMVNWIVGVRFGKAIPGYGAGQYDGSSHGPPTLAWGAWPGLHRVSRSEVQAGDIIVWTGHMGIAISNAQMVSAQDPADKTRVGPIDGGGNGPLLKMGRIS